MARLAPEGKDERSRDDSMETEDIAVGADADVEAVDP